MRYGHIVYPSALESLDSSGLTARIDKAVASHKVRILGFVSDTDVIEMIREIKDIYAHIPADERKKFQDNMQRAFASRKEHAWRTNRLGGVVATEDVEEEDFLAFGGWWSAQVLNPEEVFDYRKFGFDNISDFTGSVAAMINQKIHRDFNPGYKWAHKMSDGRVFQNEIGGDSNADMRIFRTDVTPYETIDPLGNRVSFRPEMNADKGVVAPYHSVEDSFLGAVMTWVDQAGISAPSLNEGLQDTIKWAHSLGQAGGNTAEHLFRGVDDLRLHMNYTTEKLPVLDENDHSERMSSFWLPSSGADHGYPMYVGNSGNFVLASENIRKPSDKKNIAVEFTPQEADHLVNGVLYQAAKGLGRTSSAQLLSMLERRLQDKR